MQLKLESDGFLIPGVPGSYLKTETRVHGELRLIMPLCLLRQLRMTRCYWG